jgi:hypothetical protein
MIRVQLPTSCPAQDILRLALGRIPRKHDKRARARSQSGKTKLARVRFLQGVEAMERAGLVIRTVAIMLTVRLIKGGKPGRRGFGDCDWLLECERCRLLDRTDLSGEVEVVEDEDGLDDVGRGHSWIFDHDEVISVALFAALGHVRRTGEDLRGGQIEVRDDEFVVLVNACAGAEFSGEGLRRVGFQVGPADDAFGSVRLLDGEAAFLVRDAITEDALAGQLAHEPALSH